MSKTTNHNQFDLWLLQGDEWHGWGRGAGPGTDRGSQQPDDGDEADRGGAREGEGLLLRWDVMMMKNKSHHVIRRGRQVTIAMLVNLSALVPGKLRDVEVMCQENEGVEGGDLIRKVSEIILLNNYANNVQLSFHFQKVNVFSVSSMRGLTISSFTQL